MCVLKIVHIPKYHSCTILSHAKACCPHFQFVLNPTKANERTPIHTKEICVEPWILMQNYCGHQWACCQREENKNQCIFKSMMIILFASLFCVYFATSTAMWLYMNIWKGTFVLWSVQDQTYILTLCLSSLFFPFSCLASKGKFGDVTWHLSLLRNAPTLNLILLLCNYCASSRPAPTHVDVTGKNPIDFTGRRTEPATSTRWQKQLDTCHPILVRAHLWPAISHMEN